MADPAEIQLNLDNDQAGQVVQQNFPAGFQSMLAFKVEQSKLPDFWGQKAKDTVTSIVFIRKIDDLARTVINAAFLFFETSKLWVLFCIFVY
jgi:hypothetical protein